MHYDVHYAYDRYNAFLCKEMFADARTANV